MTAYIPLTDGTFAVVDLEDVPKIFDVSLNWWKNNRGYAVSKHKVNSTGYSRFYHMHRLVADTPASLQTDHANRDRLDNRKDNLRAVINSQNQANKIKVRPWGKRPSRFKGLSSRGKGWRIYCKGKYLGYEINEALAALTYNSEAYAIWGAHSLLNELVFDGGTGILLDAYS